MGIDAKVKNLPPDMQREVMDFVEFLIQRRAANRRDDSKPVSQNWAGGLSEFRDRFTSVDLQHKAREWRGDSVSR